MRSTHVTTEQTGYNNMDKPHWINIMSVLSYTVGKSMPRYLK